MNIYVITHTTDLDLYNYAFYNKDDAFAEAKAIAIRNAENENSLRTDEREDYLSITYDYENFICVNEVELM